MKTILQEFVEANEFKITGGSDYCWDCFGYNARWLEFDEAEQFSISCIFDSIDQTVYSMEAWDYVNDREYRWINPEYVDAYKKEAKKKKIDSRESCEGRNFVDLELEEDMFAKIRGIRSGEQYDTRVQVPLTLEDDVLFRLMMLAHEKDITLNEMVEEVLWLAIEEAKKGEQFE